MAKCSQLRFAEMCSNYFCSTWNKDSVNNKKSEEEKKKKACLHM